MSSHVGTCLSPSLCLSPAAQFSDPDLKISMQQLAMFLQEAPPGPNNVPFPALRYLTGECNYGGRVTDDHDRRTLMAVLQGLYTPEVLDDNFRFSPSGLYYAPPGREFHSSHNYYLEFIKSLPITAAPEAFGLHANADITKDQQEVDLLYTSILLTQERASVGVGASREQVLGDLCTDILGRVPKPFDLEAASYKYPTDYHESMNTVLCNELVRFNRLIEVIRSSLGSLQKALKGLVVMSTDLEQVAQAMFDGRIPAMWAAKSYPSLKPLAGYTADLAERLKGLALWLEQGPPLVFWISGFFFTHAFLTGVLQNYARHSNVPIDTVGFEFECMPATSADGHGGGGVTEKPAHGAYITGMYLEGARWDAKTSQLEESHPKVLYSTAPLIWLKPCRAADRAVFPCYDCPVYRTAERRGVLATTGHSSNFVLDLQVREASNDSESDRGSGRSDRTVGRLYWCPRSDSSRRSDRSLADHLAPLAFCSRFLCSCRA